MRNSQGFEFYPGKRLPVVCRDGVTRSAVCTGFASGVLPAAVQITLHGKRATVSGFISARAITGALEFTASGRNRNLIPWTSHKPRLAKLALRLIMATAYGKGAPGYIWDSGASHARALAEGCRAWQTAGAWPQGGHDCTREFKRIDRTVLPRLALFFERQARFIND